MADNKKIAMDVLDAVGGKENINKAMHCMTRLRLSLKDKNIADLDRIKTIKGVAGALFVGEQLQIIIGQNVSKVYIEFCQIAQIESQVSLNENLDAPKEKLTLKK